MRDKSRFNQYLPTLWIFPIKIQSIETVFLNEGDCPVNETLPGRWIVNQLAVLAAQWVVPTTQTDQDLDTLLFKCRYFGVKIWPVFVSVGPWIENLHNSFTGIEGGETVDDVGAQSRIDVLRFVLATFLTITSPVGEVADDFEAGVG